MEETGVPGENHGPAVTHWQTLSHTVESRTPHLSRIQTHTIVVIDTDCIGICETNLLVILPCDHDHDSPYRLRVIQV